MKIRVVLEVVWRGILSHALYACARPMSRTTLTNTKTKSDEQQERTFRRSCVGGRSRHSGREEPLPPVEHVATKPHEANPCSRAARKAKMNAPVERWRLFAAIDVPPEVKEAITRVQNQLRHEL